MDVKLSIPAAKARTIALVYQAGYVTAREHENGNVVLQAQIPKVLAGELKPYVVASEVCTTKAPRRQERQFTLSL